MLKPRPCRFISLLQSPHCSLAAMRSFQIGDQGGRLLVIQGSRNSACCCQDVFSKKYPKSEAMESDASQGIAAGNPHVHKLWVKILSRHSGECDWQNNGRIHAGLEKASN